jgi:hypothetical protein
LFKIKLPTWEILFIVLTPTSNSGNLHFFLLQMPYPKVSFTIKYNQNSETSFCENMKLTQTYNNSQKVSPKEKRKFYWHLLKLFRTKLPTCENLFTVLLQLLNLAILIFFYCEYFTLRSVLSLGSPQNSEQVFVKLWSWHVENHHNYHRLHSQ